MIKKIKGKYVVLSEKTGRSFGSYATKAEAEHRLGQIETAGRIGSSGPILLLGCHRKGCWKYF
jgi:hypothetical protein